MDQKINVAEVAERALGIDYVKLMLGQDSRTIAGQIFFQDAGTQSKTKLRLSSCVGVVAGPELINGHAELWCGTWYFKPHIIARDTANKARGMGLAAVVTSEMLFPDAYETIVFPTPQETRETEKTKRR